MNNSDFKLAPYLSVNQERVNQGLALIFKGFDQNRELIQAMNHSLMAGGKRLRPVLCFAAAKICGKDPLIALPAACAIEMIHTYSLIHDDLPAMDDDDLRRGMPTCHKKFSESTAVLAGDALLTHAFHVLANPGFCFDVYPGMADRLKLIQKISLAAGVNGMVEGQMLDMQSHNPTVEDRLYHLKEIHGLKTGRIISVSVESGAISAGASSDVTRNLIGYAEKIGLAFQVVDDVLNIEGDPEIMGKASGSDQINDKMTFPAIIGLEASKKYAVELVDQACETLSGFDNDDVLPLKAIAQYIINRDH